jgi:glycerophosphoryl diester phosphodiesterase
MARGPWLQRRVLAYAHQGGAWEGPSSTLSAIRQALAVGSTGIELDVHATLDGELVVCHDATLERTTDGRGRVAQHTLAQLEALDNAYWFVPGADVTPGLAPEAYPCRGRAPRNREYGIATLRAVLEEFPCVVLNLDIKQTAPAVPGYEVALAALLNEFERSDDVIVASFHDVATARFAAAAPTIATSAGMAAAAEFWRSVHAGVEPGPLESVALQVPEHFGGVLVVDEAFVTAAHRQGVAVHVWTVNDEASIGRLVELGVDGIMSDVPSVLCQALDELGKAWQPH